MAALKNAQSLTCSLQRICLWSKELPSKSMEEKVGFYINPEGSNSNWLQNNGTEISKEAATKDFDALRSSGKTPVALIGKGLTSAASVLNTRSEVHYFSKGEAAKPSNRFFSVDNASLKTVMNEDDAEEAGVS